MDDDDEGGSWHRNCVAAQNNTDVQNHWKILPPIPLEMSDEIWSPDLHDRSFTLGAEGGLGPKGKATLSSRFNRLALGYTNPDRPLGVLAAGLESGQLELWAPTQITDKTDALGWNAQVVHILASSSLSGYTVVWDLRGKREVVALQYGGGGGPVGGPGPGSGAGGVRRGVSDVACHPDNATRLITASEDDSQSVIMLWDLRNARAPERILQGHERGVLSVSWCPQDPELLISCGKDNRTLVWNPSSGGILGQHPPSKNWSFLTSWNPRDPDKFATANYDGSIALHSIQSTAPTSTTTTAPKAPANPNDIFDPANFTGTADAQNLGSSLNLGHAPKWLKPPVGARFGFGGVLVEVTNTGMYFRDFYPN
ncbi:hypothetical protein RSOLAG1IB_11674 [Rhizoctonia solani AG-1 IB]|uniref:Protein transport protein SEC31 n=1 Tax=Thanatephorus cucumeris (strain AG1-IB / isolate 7/3/14) TaxID=1108050 RepID=A0A0B7FDW8_THACB|nr:hypothetical protein RSOLAG1IB_11674 [Rhizoctonia solani AG-1 IB]